MQPFRTILSRGLKVLVVDDSAVVRELMTQILEAEGAVVSVAADPVIALAKIKKNRPNVIVSDVVMPRMNGLEFVRRVMAADPIPVVMCSAVTGAGAEMSMRALEAGAVAIITKPTLGVNDFLLESAEMLLETIAGASLARCGLRKLGDPPALTPAVSGTKAASGKIIAIGASIGGTEAISSVLTELPADAPGIVMVQHMPEGFTKAFAERMNSLSLLEVREACHGDELLAGVALLARGNRHMALARHRGKYIVEYSDGPPVSGHRPSVDLLFASVAEAAGSNAVGVLLTGMGADGARGLCRIKRAGGYTIAQDEESCVVFGMPGEAILLGGADEVAPLSRIPASILRRSR